MVAVMQPRCWTCSLSSGSSIGLYHVVALLSVAQHMPVKAALSGQLLTEALTVFERQNAMSRYTTSSRHHVTVRQASWRMPCMYRNRVALPNPAECAGKQDLCVP